MNTTPTLTADDIPMEFTLEGLREHFSDEEIAAMQEGDDPILPDVDLKAGAEPENEDNAEDAAANAADDDASKPADDVPPTVLQEPDPERPAPINISEQKAAVEAFDGKIEELQQQYDDGELTSAEWNAQLRALVKEQAAAQAALDAAEAAMADLAPKQEAYRNAWIEKVSAYQQQHAYLETPEHWDNWDAALKMVNSNGAYANLNMAQRIETAHRIYAAHYESLEGKPLPSRPGLTTAQKQAEASKPAPRTDERPDPPTTLADLTNAADDNGIEDGRFAQIDRVADKDPVLAEQMVAALSEADRIAYLNI